MDNVMGQNDERIRCRGMLHIVKQGDTLYKIAKQYGVPLSRVMYANPYVDVYNLQVGDEICVPVMGPRPPMPGMPGNCPGMRPPVSGNRPGMCPPMSGNCPGMRPPVSGNCPGMRPPMSGNCPRNGMDDMMPTVPGNGVDNDMVPTMPTTPGNDVDNNMMPTVPTTPGNGVDNDMMPTMPGNDVDNNMMPTMPTTPGNGMDDMASSRPGNELEGRMPQMPGSQFGGTDAQEDMIPPLQQGGQNGMRDSMREGCKEQLCPAIPGEQMNHGTDRPGKQMGHGATMPWNNLENEERMLEEYLMGMPRKL